MRIVTDYFAAPTDALAATVVHQSDGPSTATRGSGQPMFDTVRLPSVDPFVMLGRLSELICRRPYGELTSHPRHGALVGGADDEGPWVVTISDELTKALAAASPGRLADVAGRWATVGTTPTSPRTIGSTTPPALLARSLVALGDLAGRAIQVRHALYCWTQLPTEQPLAPVATRAPGTTSTGAPDVVRTANPG